MKYEEEYKFYLARYITKETGFTNTWAKEKIISCALAIYDIDASNPPKTHQEFEALVLKMIG